MKFTRPKISRVSVSCVRTDFNFVSATKNPKVRATRTGFRGRILRALLLLFYSFYAKPCAGTRVDCTGKSKRPDWPRFVRVIANESRRTTSTRQRWPIKINAIRGRIDASFQRWFASKARIYPAASPLVSRGPRYRSIKKPIDSAAVGDDQCRETVLAPRPITPPVIDSRALRVDVDARVDSRPVTSPVFAETPRASFTYPVSRSSSERKLVALRELLSGLVRVLPIDLEDETGAEQRACQT